MEEKPNKKRGRPRKNWVIDITVTTEPGPEPINYQRLNKAIEAVASHYKEDLENQNKNQKETK